MPDIRMRNAWCAILTISLVGIEISAQVERVVKCLVILVCVLSAGVITSYLRVIVSRFINFVLNLWMGNARVAMVGIP